MSKGAERYQKVGSSCPGDEEGAAEDDEDGRRPAGIRALDPWRTVFRRPGAVYCFYFAWMASHGRFTSLFLSERGLTDSQIGLLLSVRNVISIVTTPVFSNLADTAQHERWTIPGTVIRGHEAVLVVLTTLTSFAWMAYSGPELGLVPSAWAFPYFFLVRIVYSIGISATYGIVDGLALRRLKELGRDPSTYGVERLWGAVGWAVSGLTLGIIADYTGLGVTYVFVPITQILLASTLFLFSLDLNVDLSADVKVDGDDVVTGVTGVELQAHTDTAGEDPTQSSKAQTDPEVAAAVASTATDTDRATDRATDRGTSAASESSSDVATMGMMSRLRLLCTALCSEPTNAAFVLVSVVLTIGTSIIEDLVFLYFSETLGASMLLCGVSVVVTVVFEIPIFTYAESLLSHGPPTLLAMACLCYTTRVIGYTLVPNGWYVLFLEPLHGITYSCAKTAAVHFVQEVTPPGLEASAQGLMGTLQMGIGATLGTGVGGVVEDVYGPRMLYRGAAALVLAALSFYCLLLFVCRMIKASAARAGAKSPGAALAASKLTNTYSPLRQSSSIPRVGEGDEF